MSYKIVVAKYNENITWIDDEIKNQIITNYYFFGINRAILNLQGCKNNVNINYPDPINVYFNAI